MGFLTRLLAGLTAAAALGAGLTGTANAVDVTGATGTTKSVVKLTADDTNNLPDHLVNGDFSVNYHDQWKDSFGGWTSIDPNAGKTLHATNYVDSSGTWKWTAINGWDRSKFGWTSTQKAGSNVQQKANAVELQYDDSTADNVYAELCAYEAGTAIYQDIRTTPGTLYKVRLKHASLNQSYLDKMQVMIGAPGHEQPVEMTRTSVNGHGDKLNEKSTTIATKVTNGNNRHHADQWETYEGTYLIPDGQTTTRFTFRSVDSKQLDYGNVLDGIVFDKAYRLDYDKNASDASGQVPSNQRGKENTVQPAKAKTTGTVKTVVDTSDGLPTELVNGDFEYPGADVLSQNLRDKKRNWWGVSRKDKMVYESDNPTKWVSLPSTFDSDRFAWDSSEAGKTSGVQEGSSQWHTNEVELQRDSRTGNMYAELSPYQAQSSIRQYIRTTPGTLYKVRLKHASLSSEYLDKMQVLIGADGNEQPVRMTRVESQNGLDATGKSTASTTISTHASNKAEISWGSGLGYHSSRNHDGQWATYEGVYVATSDVTVFTFKSVDSPSFNTGNLLDDVVFTKAYKLTYDKNSADASGQVPSNQRGKENTTQPAKTKTSGIVKTVADDTSNLPDHLVNGDFSVNYKDQWLTGGWNWTSITPDGKYLNSVRNWNDSATTWKTVNGWDKTKFGWSSTQKDGTDNIQHKAGAVEIQYDDLADNVYAELCAYEAGTAIYQDIKTVPGTLYKVRLKHASLYDGYLDKMQVMIGTPGHEQPVEMTRTGVNGNGDKLNEKSNIIATKVSNTGENDRNHDSQWESYEGTYLIPAGQTVTRFTFRSVGSRNLDHGNLLDDIVFDKAYRLDYDKNSNEAAGSVPSNQRGRENTVQPAKAEAGGTVRTIADASKSLTVNPGFDVPDYSKLDDGGLHWMYVNPSEGNAWSYYDYINPSAPKHQVAGLSQATFGWQELTGGDHKTTSFELHREKDGNVCADVHGSRTIGQTIDTQAGVAYTVSIRHSGRSKGNAGSVQVLVGPDKDHLQPLEMSRMNVSRTGAKYGDKTGKVGTVITTHSDSVDSTEGDHPAWDHSDDWETYSGTYVATGGKTVFAYRGVDENGDSVSGNDPVADSVIDDLSFKLAYRLSYDKNAADAAGSIPSDEYGKENTVRQAKSKANGSVKLVADDDVAEYAANGLPKQIMNGDFDHDWRNIVGQSRMSAKYNFANIDPAHGDVEISGALNGKGEASKHWVHLNGFDASRFGWKSNQTDTRVDGRGGIVEIQRSRANDNMYAEITASQANTYLYQDIDTAHDYPTVYTVKLRYAHRNGTINSNEKIQILVGAPGHEQPVEMTRIASDRGNRLGEKSTTVNAPNTDGWLGSWDTFQGSVVVPAGRNVSRFTFKALGSIDGISGNLIDDVQFKLAYKLSYDKNSQDAFGQVPSDETANTVKQAKTRTTGTVRAVADDVDGLPTELINGDFQTYGNEAINRRPNYELTFVDGSGNVMTGKDINGTWGRLDSWDSAKFGWKSNDTARGHSSIVEVQRPFNTPSTSTSTNVWGEIAAASQGKYIYQDIATTPGVMYKWSIKHASRNTARDDSMQVLIGEPGEEIAQEATRATSNGSDKTGKVGTMITTHGVAQYGQWETYTGTYIATSTVTRFTFKSVTDVMAGGGSDSAEGNCIDDVMFMKAYKLTYDKNAADATGSVPSNTTPGTTQTISSRTEGKVSDLVQRTTTHEDGSVTVRTVDTTTGVVSGCQVYYPAGQRITLATMAKDDDCWDSSMLSRPGHTQLGWNQDRNATQAQAEVTMVEGGMTVFAVWVGNPVLTYDTNKPSTWSGQMPSTPASVSVAYNTAAADGSGWAAGDTSKIRGYKFLGWYTAPQDNTGLYQWATPLTGNVTVYAHWQRLQANVVYNANGGTGSHPNTTGWQYSDVTIPGDTSKSFKRDKYVFKGWGTKPGKADVVYKDGSKVALQDKDITLYAQWQEVHENFVETGGIGLPIAIAGGVLLLMFGIGSTVMLTRRMNGHGMPDDE
mgnify:CR=1 FL=1